MGKFDGILGGFNSSFFPLIKEGRAANARKQQAAAAQKLAQDRLGLQQDAFGLQQQRFDAGQDDKAAAAGLAQEDRDRQVNQDLGRALNIQNAVDAGRSSGTLSDADVARIGAAGGGDEQSALLNSITSENQELARNAPIQDLEQQRLVAGIESDQALTQQRVAAAGAQPAGSSEMRLLSELGLEPTLENLAQVRSAGSSQSSQAQRPVTVSPGSTLVNPETGEAIFQAPQKSAASKVTAGDRKIAGYHSRASKAQDAVRGMEEGGLNPASIGKTLSSVGGRYLMSDEAKAYEDNQDEFIRVMLRKDSGAAISDEEQENYSRYFPKFGDGPKDIARKSQQRDVLVQSLRDEAGGAIESAGAGADAQGFTTSAGGNKYKVVQ